MARLGWNFRGMWLLGVAALAACAQGNTPEGLERVPSNLSANERIARASLIRDSAATRGLYNGVLLAGIADAETGMSQCWSELTWACKGPASPSCGGGPVVAGAGDGPCSLEQGGLGMFQFDGGTFAQTLERDGEGILTIEGNAARAVEFVVAMVQRSVYITPKIEGDDAALAWLNEVRPWNSLWEPWIKTVTHYYNGCTPQASCWSDRFARYGKFGQDIYAEMGAEFWYGVEPGCGAIPAGGATLDDQDLCFGAGGSPMYWRTESGQGNDGTLLWTVATDKAEASNWAFWRLLFVEEGTYRVEVSTSSAIGSTDRARYEVRHADGVQAVAASQTGKDGFLDLGTYRFGTMDGQGVYIFDNTGEPGTDMRKLVADAVRVTRMAADAPRGPGTNLEPTDNGGVGVSGGCSTAGPGAWSREAGAWLWLLVVAIAFLRATRRSTPAREP
ncbi:MAG: hypothetical protein R3A78_01455 [Polyangiales bacterium]